MLLETWIIWSRVLTGMNLLLLQYYYKFQISCFFFYTLNLRMKIFIRLHRAFLLVNLNFFQNKSIRFEFKFFIEKHGGDEWKFSFVRCK